jgi:hypothetical protein
VTAAGTTSTRAPAGVLCLHITAMLAEAVERFTGHEPFAPILTTFQYTLLNEDEDAQMGGTKYFRGFHDRNGFSRVGLIFHGDASTLMNCPTGHRTFAW